MQTFPVYVHVVKEVEIRRIMVEAKDEAEAESKVLRGEGKITETITTKPNRVTKLEVRGGLTTVYRTDQLFDNLAGEPWCEVERQGIRLEKLLVTDNQEPTPGSVWYTIKGDGTLELVAKKIDSSG
jgi:hypothetical protein